ncbi:hypothetical protein KEH56_17420 [Burkholderia cenocepacia]|uniref:hypothetical protein n=1 Tax=Burkholderia cenocepacia TaxID=95486 RepID=UPI001BA58F31|nr:hypothetical protein [Burkholderia cenocepacia]QUN40885.1 hypothetical protein KEH56_17420 [Burkholderia cenocepacia]QUO27145.1 hypothetical protein KEH57_20105 [Burkholderia cenocepacia]
MASNVMMKRSARVETAGSAGLACRIILRRRSHGQTIKKNIESRKYSFRPTGGLRYGRWLRASRRVRGACPTISGASTLAVAMAAGMPRFSDRTESRGIRMNEQRERRTAFTTTGAAS